MNFFTGVLHMEVFSQRLEQEYGAASVLVSPSVPYRQVLRATGEVRTVTNPANFITETSRIEKCQEPMVKGTIVAPTDYMNVVVAMLGERRCQDKDVSYLGQTRFKVNARLPLAEIVVDFVDELKRATSGFASFDYEEDGWETVKLVKMDILLNGEPVPEMSAIVYAGLARVRGRQVVDRLVESLPRQQFSIAVQAAVGTKIMARADVKQLRKEVTAKCYGGDITRKMKLLKRQAEGKKRMRMIGKVEVPKDTYVKILRRS